MTHPLRSLIALLAVGGCSSPPPTNEVLGPFTGETRRFVVDRIEMPTQKDKIAVDLDGDGRTDDQLAGILSALAQFTSVGEGTAAGANAQVGAGTIAPALTITSDDAALFSDPTVGLQWIDDATHSSDLLGARLEAGTIASPLARQYDHARSALVTLPVAGAADPVPVELSGIDMTLTPDGAGGFTGEMHGAIRMIDPRPFHSSCAHVIQQILDAWPQDHQAAFALLDPNRDGTVSVDELENGSFRDVFEPDLQLFDAKGNWHPDPKGNVLNALSLGFRFHLLPCPSGPCLTPALPSCLDRQRNGTETDRDCGGPTCHPCAPTLACQSGPDCQSTRCTNGLCEK